MGIRKGRIVSKLKQDWANIRKVLDKRPGALIGLRLTSTVLKQGLFYKGQRGVVTDVQMLPKKIYIFITWDNIADEYGEFQLPPQRIVKFNAKKMWQYVDPCVKNILRRESKNFSY